MAAEKNSSSASSLASLRLLKLEEDTLLKLSAQMRDQLNRLKVSSIWEARNLWNRRERWYVSQFRSTEKI